MNAAGEKTVRFVVVNDCHAQFAPGLGGPGYPGATERVEWLLAQLMPGGSLAEVDFVLSAGDIINGESLPAISAEMAALRARVEALHVAALMPGCWSFRRSWLGAVP